DQLRAWQVRAIQRRKRGAASSVLGDAQIGDDVVGVVSRTRQRRVRPDEGLTGACVEFDTQTRDLDPRNRALERLLVDGNDVNRAGLEVDLDLFGKGGPKGQGERKRHYAEP